MPPNTTATSPKMSGNSPIPGDELPWLPTVISATLPARMPAMKNAVAMTLLAGTPKSCDMRKSSEAARI